MTDRIDNSEYSQDQPGAPKINVPVLSDGEFVKVARELITKLDSEKHCFLTEQQLAKALENPNIKAKEAQALAAMYENFDKLQNLVPPLSIWDPKGISYDDLASFGRMEKEHSKRLNDATALKSWAPNNMIFFDKDGDGSLALNEIDTAIKNGSTPQQDKEMLRKVKDNYSEIAPWFSDTNPQAIATFAEGVESDTSAARLVSAIKSTSQNVSDGQSPQICHDLYSDRENPLASINPDAIRQGSLQDCYFLAALAAVAKSNPQKIMDAIQDNGNGTYTVSFPGAQEKITVKAPTQAEQGIYNHASPNGTWASVMEKAFGEYYRRQSLAGANTPAEGAGGGGRPGYSLEFLTGNPVDRDIVGWSFQSSIATKLEDAFKNNKAVTAGITSSNWSSHTADDFFRGHAYSITGFVAGPDGSGMVTIRNPWGGEKGSTQGTISISLEKFMSNFSEIHFEQ